MTSGTANGEYKFDQEFFGRKLSQWVAESHRALAKASGWGFCRPLVPGQFGYDNMAMSLATLFSEMENMRDNQGEDDIDLDYMADLIHQGWVKNYCYWRDHTPFDREEYKKPNKKLGDARRNKCAESPYQDLPQDEKDKDLIIARHVFQTLS